jgi:hypothetical protein
MSHASIMSSTLQLPLRCCGRSSAVGVWEQLLLLVMG